MTSPGAVLVDTGVLFGAADRDDARHGDCVAVLEAHRASLATTVPVLVESAWLIEARLGPAAEAAFIRSVNVDELERIDLTEADWQRVAELIDDYHDLGLGAVDASIVAVAERLEITTVLTLNHRDFRVVRPRHTAAFELVP